MSIICTTTTRIIRFGVRKTIFAMTLPMLITAHCGRVQHAEKLQCVPNALSAAAT